MYFLGRVCLTIWCAFWGIFWTGFMAFLYLVPSLFHTSVEWMDRVQTFYGRTLLPLMGIRLEVNGKEHLDSTRTVILMANHRSYLDIPVVSGQLPRLRFVAKKELGRIPIFGWALQRSEHALIDRHDRVSAVTALKEMASVFGKGRNLVVFPEGTRAKTPRLLPFKKGGFHLALDTGLPIQPVSISGMEVIYPKGQLLLKPGHVVLSVHPAISVKDKTRADIPALMQETRQAMLRGLPESVSLEGASE